LGYIEGGTLLQQFKYFNQYKEEDAKLIMAQILLTLNYLHNMNIIHRDIKLDNILINKISKTKGYSVKISDFGLAVN
jgi:serine/threonine protein kinase